VTTHDPEPHTPSARPRRGLVTILLAAVACSVCLLPALVTAGAMASITGWLTGTIGLAIAATILTIGVGLLRMRRHGAQATPCRCSNCA